MVVDGNGFILEPVALLLQENVPPGTEGTAVNVAGCPKQIVALLTDRVDEGLTTTVAFALDAVQPVGKE